jgi:hypothetical protein
MLCGSWAAADHCMVSAEAYHSLQQQLLLLIDKAQHS